MTDITQLLGKDAESLLQHRCITIPSDQLYLPGADYVDRVMVDNNRPPVSYTHLRAHETRHDLVCRLLLEKKKKKAKKKKKKT